MRTLTTLATVLLLAALPGCAFDEGINIHDMSGTVLVPKSAAPTADDVGMIYVGLYSGVDNSLGFPSPVSAPAASTAGADTFPYGGTSIGSFYTRDAREVCQKIESRSVRDGGTNWELDFDILQFPFYEGTSVWAWMDTLVLGSGGVNAYTTCDPDNGYRSYYQIEVNQIDAQADGAQWVVTFEDSDMPDVPGGSATRKYQDAAGQLWKITALDPVTDSITVADVYSWGGKPQATGPSQPIIFSEAESMYFGSQFQDVLNFPGKYVRGNNGTPGDYVAQNPFVLDNLSGNVEITIDFEVP